jgi:hypothetical protein
VIRLLVAAGVLAAVLSSADARPVWRQVPTPLPPVIHTAKVRPPYIGPAWRFAPVAAVVDVAGEDADPTPAESPAVAEVTPETLPPPEKTTEVAAARTPPPALAPAPVVVAQTEVAAPVSEPAPVAPPPPPTAPIAGPAVTPTGSWLDYVGVLALAAIIAATIFFVARERRRPA